MMQDFFKLVLPESGWKFVVTIKDGRTTHHTCAAFSEMESVATTACAQGIDTYFACASFAEAEYVDGNGKKRTRTRANAVAAKSFWLDIDVGDGKPYASQSEALIRLRSFCDYFMLPRPMLVSSGYGLHCYWPLFEDVTKDHWFPVAAKLKALTKNPACPLLVDHSRTSDIASILRSVQTRNFKHDPAGVPVEVLAPVEAKPFEEFRSAVAAAYARIAPTIVYPEIGQRNPSCSNRVDIIEIEDALHFIDPDRGDRGDWWKVIAALADEFGEEGREVAHRWSRGDFREVPSNQYDTLELDAQFDDCLGRDDYDGDRAGVGTIHWLARQGGWTGGTPDWVQDLNDQYAWIEKVNAIYRLKFGDFARPADFRQKLANQYVEVSSGETRKRVSAGDAWLRHPARREHDDLVMWPAGPRVTGGNRLNTWQGLAVEPVPGDTALFFELFDRLIPDADAGRYVRSWLAHLFQHPNIKMSTALVIWSRQQGVGKNLVFECIKDIIGQRHAILIGQSELDRDFNGWARDKIVIIGDEVIGQDRRQHADKLKALITGTTILINEKHQPAVELQNLANFIFLSNQPNAVFIGDDDRRYFVWEVEAGPLTPQQARNFADWRDGGGLSALLHHLRSLDIADFNPKARAPSTAAKRMMIEDNRSDFEVWAVQLIASGAGKIIGREMATAAELAERYRQDAGAKVSTRTVTTTLKRLGATQREHQVRVRQLKVRPIALDRPDHWQREPETSWAAEMCKPLLGLTLPHQCLTRGLAQKPDLHVISQEDAA